jgi:hypothetical protein
MDAKIQPIPVDKMPTGLRGACESFARQIDQANAQKRITNEELRAAFGLIEDWAHRQSELLGGRAQGGSSGATTAA